MGIARQEYWSGLSCPPPGDLPYASIETSLLKLLHCRQILFQLSHREAQFRYDLNQIPYNLTVDVTNRFKGLDLITQCLKNYGQRFMTLYRRQ